MRFPRAIIDAANYGFRFRSMLEAAVIVLVIMAATTVALNEYQRMVARAQLSESLVLFGGLKTNLGAFYGQHGRWPQSRAEKDALELEETEFVLGSFVRRIDIGDDGILTAQFLDSQYVSTLIADQVVAFRPMINTNDPAAPIAWSCGYWVAPPGFDVPGHNSTTVDAALLPSICRRQTLYE